MRLSCAACHSRDCCSQNRSVIWLRCAKPADRRSSPHAALGEELLEPVDVVVAVDDLLFAYQRAEQRQRGFDSVDDELVQRTLEAHQAFAAGLAVYDELAHE